MLLYQNEVITRIGKICEEVPYRLAKEIYDLLNTGKNVEVKPQQPDVAGKQTNPAESFDKVTPPKKTGAKKKK